jgi:hypothetical protein
MHTALVYNVSSLLHIGETEDTATWTCYIHMNNKIPFRTTLQAGRLQVQFPMRLLDF